MKKLKGLVKLVSIKLEDYHDIDSYETGDQLLIELGRDFCWFTTHKTSKVVRIRRSSPLGGYYNVQVNTLAKIVVETESKEQIPLTNFDCNRLLSFSDLYKIKKLEDFTPIEIEYRVNERGEAYIPKKLEELYSKTDVDMFRELYNYFNQNSKESKIKSKYIEWFNLK